MPDLLPLILAARLLVCEARVSFADGHSDRGLEALATLSRMAGSLYEESTLVCYLIGLAVERMYLITGAEAAAEGAPWVDRRFLSALEEMTPATDLNADLERVLSFWQETVLAAAESGKRDWEGNRGPVKLPRSLHRDEVAAARQKAVELIRLPYGTHLDRFDAIGTLDKGTGNEWWSSDLAGFGASIGRAQSIAAQRQLLAAVIEMRRIGFAEGAYPTTRPPVAVLIEPDPFSARLIVYSRRADGNLVLDLDGFAELLEPITVAGMARYLRPLTLPPPV